MFAVIFGAVISDMHIWYHQVCQTSNLSNRSEAHTCFHHAVYIGTINKEFNKFVILLIKIRNPKRQVPEGFTIMGAKYRTEGQEMAFVDSAIVSKLLAPLRSRFSN